MPTDSNQMIILDEFKPFTSPIPYESIQVGGIDECICNYDFYSTGDVSRAKGCGGLYYERYYLDNKKYLHCERTPCQCMLQIKYEIETKKKNQGIQTIREALRKKTMHYFSQTNLLWDEAHAHMTLDRFTPEHPSQTIALKTLAEFQIGKEGICLYGDSGRGKTHLALGAAHQATQQGHLALAIKSIDLLNCIKQSYEKKDAVSKNDIIYILKNIDLLVIDDIGAEQTTNWVTAKLYEIIDFRYNRKSTIFTTNLTGNQLKEKEGMSLVSRIWGAGKRFEIEGKDWRI